MSRARQLPLGRIVLVAAGIAALAVAGRQLAALVPAFAETVEGLGAWGVVLFVLGYAVAAVAFVPGVLFTLAAGALFGIAKGLAVALGGAMLGASAAFLTSRYLARGAVERRVAADRRFAAIDRAVGREGRRIVFLLRLSPLVPFNLLNYALGLTRVRFGDYLVGSLGMAPATLLYVYYGTVVGDVARLAGGVPSGRGPAHYALLGLGLVATIVVTTLVTRTAQRALREATDDDDAAG